MKLITLFKLSAFASYPKGTVVLDKDKNKWHFLDEKVRIRDFPYSAKRIVENPLRKIVILYITNRYGSSTIVDKEDFIIPELN